MKHFKEEIADEVSEYKRKMGKRGNSAPVILTEDINNLVVTERDLRLLCNAYINGDFDEWDVNYLAEALLLSEKVSYESNKLEDALSALTDPEFMNLVSIEYVHNVLRELGA